MTHKGASFLILFWGIFNLLGGAAAFFYMGTFAQPVLIMGLLAGVLGFSAGHFMNRGRKEAIILALAFNLMFVFLLGSFTSEAFNQDQNYIFPDALAVPSQNIYLLVTSAMLTATVLVLLLLLIFVKPIYSSFKRITETSDVK